MQSTTHESAARPVLLFLSRPLTEDELKAVGDRGFEVPLPQKPILDARLTEVDLSWFRQQPFFGKVEFLPRNDAELRAMAAALA